MELRLTWKDTASRSREDAMITEHKIHFASEQDKQITGLLTFASKDETRSELCGILLEVRPKATTVRAVATSGSALGTLELLTPVGTEIEVSHNLFIPWTVFGPSVRKAATALKALFKGYYGCPIVLTYEYDNEKQWPTKYTLCNTANATQTSWESELHTFPDWRRVFPNLDKDCRPTEAIGYNLQLMAPYFTVRYGNKSSRGGTFVPSVFTDALSTTVFLDTEDPTFLGLIMPLRMPMDADEMREAVAAKISTLQSSQ